MMSKNKKKAQFGAASQSNVDHPGDSHCILGGWVCPVNSCTQNLHTTLLKHAQFEVILSVNSMLVYVVFDLSPLGYCRNMADIYPLLVAPLILVYLLWEYCFQAAVAAHANAAQLSLHLDLLVSAGLRSAHQSTALTLSRQTAGKPSVYTLLRPPSLRLCTKTQTCSAASSRSVNTTQWIRFDPPCGLYTAQRSCQLWYVSV